MNRCAKCNGETMLRAPHLEIMHDEPISDIDEYIPWECQVPGCGWVVGRKPDMSATRDERMNADTRRFIWTG